MAQGQDGNTRTDISLTGLKPGTFYVAHYHNQGDKSTDPCASGGEAILSSKIVGQPDSQGALTLSGSVATADIANATYFNIHTASDPQGTPARRRRRLHAPDPQVNLPFYPQGAKRSASPLLLSCSLPKSRTAADLLCIRRRAASRRPPMGSKSFVRAGLLKCAHATSAPCFRPPERNPMTATLRQTEPAVLEHVQGTPTPSPHARVLDFLGAHGHTGSGALIAALPLNAAKLAEVLDDLMEVGKVRALSGRLCADHLRL